MNGSPPRADACIRGNRTGDETPAPGSFTFLIEPNGGALHFHPKFRLDEKMTTTIGFIGLGVMGRPMSKNLAATGFPLVVFDINPEPVQELVSLGATRGISPRHVANSSDMVITMLPDSPDVEQVALGVDGIMEGIRFGSIYIDMSTVLPTTAIHLFEAGVARGVRVLDAPVSGGDVGAQEGSLSIMVGGDKETFDQALPVFRVLGKRIVLCGANGSAQVVKACNQVLVAVTIQGLAEALALGTKAGVDPATIIQVLGSGLGRCGVLENRGTRIVDKDFAPGSRARLQYKDLRIAVSAGQAYGVPLPATALVHEMFKRMVLAGLGDLDHTGLVLLLDRMAQETGPNY